MKEVKLMHRVFLVLAAVVLLIVARVTAGFLVEPIWSAYTARLELVPDETGEALRPVPGSPGSPASADVPVFETLAAAEGTERFALTFFLPGGERLDEMFKLGDFVYTVLPLNDGTRVAARLNLDALEGDVHRDWQHPEDDGTQYTTPVGQWEDWALSDEERSKLAQRAPDLVSDSRYLDMAGAAEGALPLEQFRARYLWPLALAVAAVLVVGHGLWRLATFPLREANRPRNKTERWIAGTHAIWGQSMAMLYQIFPPQKGYTIRIGGAPRSWLGRRVVRSTLKSAWDITDLTGLLDTVEYMSMGPGLLHCETQAERAWELCRATSLLGMAYVAGWLNRKEMLRRSLAVCRVIQTTFSSWEELGQSFMAHYGVYAMDGRDADDGQEMLWGRASLWQKLRERRDSPYRLPWDMDLTL